MAFEIRVDPIDLELNTAVGIDLPLVESRGSNFKLNYTSLDQAVANAKNLLLTDRGERVMQPEFGCDLRKSLFQQVNDELVDQIDSRIRSNFAYWLPYIFINELRVIPNPDRNSVGLSMSISLDKNKFSTRSIQLTLTLMPNA